MIISCERCNTRFHLDEARLPAGGARVRCSQCKHAFFVRGAGMTPEQVIHAAAAEAAAESQRGAAEPDFDPDAVADAPDPASPGAFATDAPDPAPPGGIATDAPDPAPGGFMTNAAEEDGQTRVPVPEEGEEADWQFNLEEPDEGPGSLVEEALTGSETPEPLADAGLDTGELESPSDDGASADEGALSFDDLGSPESWDLLSEEPPPEAPEPGVEAPVFEGEVDEAPAVEEPAPPPVRDRRRRRPTRQGDQAGGFAWTEAARLCGWLGAALGVALTLGFAAERALRPAPIAAWAPVEVVGLVAEGVRARRVENLHAGPLTVITGTLRNAGRSTVVPGRVLQVTLEDATGLRTAIAGPPLADLYLREADPARIVEALRRSSETAARHRVASGSTVPFQAVFPGAPPYPSRVGVGDGPAVSPGPTPTVGREDAGDGARSPSPPTPPPSSE